MLPGFISHLDQSWEEPGFPRQLRRPAPFCGLIRFDNRVVFDVGGIPGTWPLFTVD